MRHAVATLVRAAAPLRTEVRAPAERHLLPALLRPGRAHSPVYRHFQSRAPPVGRVRTNVHSFPFSKTQWRFLTQPDCFFVSTRVPVSISQIPTQV